MFFIITICTPNSNQKHNNHDDVKRLLVYSKNLYYWCPYKISFKMQYLFKVEVNSTRLETESTLEKTCHM